MKVYLMVVILLLMVDFSRLTVASGLRSGHVVGWGFNVAGEATGISIPGSDHSTNVVSVAGLVLSNVVSVSAGNSHSLAVQSDATVFGWGNNFNSEAVGFKNEPPYRACGQVKIAGAVLSNVTVVAAGQGFSLALKSDGTLFAWGDNQFGQTRVPEGLRDVVAIEARGTHCLALKVDGTVASWGEANPPPVGLTNIVAIAAGGIWDYSDDLALTRDGRIVEWALRGVPREIPVPAGATNVIAIAAGWNHYLALKRDGTVFGWGFNTGGCVTGVPSTNGNGWSNGLVRLDGQILSNVRAIAAGKEFSLALKQDGTVVSWGHPLYNMRVDVPPDLSGVVAIAAGENFCLAITTNASAFLNKK